MAHQILTIPNKNKTHETKKVKWRNNNGSPLENRREYTIDTIDPITEIIEFYYNMKLINGKLPINDETQISIENYDDTQYYLYNKKKNDYETDNTLTHYSRKYSSLYCIVLYLPNEIKIFNANFLNQINAEDFGKYMLKHNCNKIELICNNTDIIKTKYIDIIDFGENNYLKNNKLLFHSFKKLYENINIIKSNIIKSKDKTEKWRLKHLLINYENKLTMIKIIATYNENLESVDKILFINI